ncbi:MAG TPA: ABC transporter substrate-binding protein [Syntrophorhabdaceae bacterium]|nr:ABC transporter substrate-binding protein [Syntrophorhabdaceae bacterium]
MKEIHIQDTVKNCLIAVLLLFAYLSSIDVAFASQETRTVIDRIGRTVSVPAYPQRIACFFGPSYEKVFLLGSADKVAAMSIKQPPWSQKFNPAPKTMHIMPSYTDPDVERILSLKIDLVFYWNLPQQMEKMSAANIPVVCPTSSKIMPKTVEQFIQSYKDDIRFYGKILGKKAERIAERYCAHYDKRIKRVLNITSRIPENERPRVYYIVGRSIFSTQGKYSLGHWLVEIAGGTLVSKNLENYFADVSMEQIIAWDPDVIILSGFISADAIYADPRLQIVKAVKNNRVYASPEGVFHWGHGSSEVFLFAMWLAKTLHPEKSKNIDFNNELKDYYKNFYRYALTDDDVHRIINRIPPEGF